MSNKRRKRYLASFTSLHAYCLDKQIQEEIGKKLDWALLNLGKDNRVVWFVGILKRHLLAGSNLESLPRKDQKKRAQALKRFGIERIEVDYRDLLEKFIPAWPHYLSMAENYRSTELEKFRFSQDERGKQVPLSVLEVMVSAHKAFAKTGKTFFCWMMVGSGFGLKEDTLNKKAWPWGIVEIIMRKKVMLCIPCGNRFSKRKKWLGDHT